MEVVGLIYVDVTSCEHKECVHNSGGKCELRRVQLYITEAKMKAVCGNYEAITKIGGDTIC